MKKLNNLDEFFDGDLYLPWKGQQWRIPEPSEKATQELQRKVMSGDYFEHVEIRKLMGQTYNELTDAGVGHTTLMHMGRTAIIWFTYGAELGEQHWHLAQFASLANIDEVIAKVKEARNGD